MTKPVQHPLAFCPVHGVFAATAFALGPGSSSTFVGSKTDCPRCGGVSEIIPGRYEAEAERLNVLLDHSSISPEALAAIKELALKLQKGTITPRLMASDSSATE
jgi:hypothetical protein